jgi:hypothetical protein
MQKNKLITYAAVFPDPVFALAKISLPSIAKGMALSWVKLVMMGLTIYVSIYQ